MAEENGKELSLKAFNQSGTGIACSKTSSEAFKQLWAKLCAAFPRQEVTVATMAIYFERLSRFDEAKLEKAVLESIDKSTFFPTIAEIIQRIPGRFVG